MDSKSLLLPHHCYNYSGSADASRPMSEKFNYVYMRQLFDDKNHEKSMSEEQKSEKRPVFIDGSEDNDVEDLLLLASQVYELEVCQLEEAAKG